MASQVFDATTAIPSPRSITAVTPSIVRADQPPISAAAPPLSDRFEPQLSPGIAVAAAAAATPPIVFWATIFTNARRAVREAEDKEAARLALLARVTGQGGGGGASQQRQDGGDSGVRRP
jgi:hypothetical protein